MNCYKSSESRGRNLHALAERMSICRVMQYSEGVHTKNAPDAVIALALKDKRPALYYYDKEATKKHPQHASSKSTHATESII
ncbi:MAG: hypothetical protein QXT39_04990 [Conexivisphaerales archaeon]